MAPQQACGGADGLRGLRRRRSDRTLARSLAQDPGKRRGEIDRGVDAVRLARARRPRRARRVPRSDCDGQSRQRNFHRQHPRSVRDAFRRARNRNPCVRRNVAGRIGHRRHTRRDAAQAGSVARFAHDPQHPPDDRGGRHLRAVGGALADGAAARAAAHHEHHCVRRASAGRFPRDRPERAPRRDRPGGDRARRDARHARSRARAGQAPGRTRHGGGAHQPRPAQHAERGAAHFRPPRRHSRSAGAAPRPPAGRDARPSDPVLPGDADLRRGAGAAARAAAVRSLRARSAGDRSRLMRSTPKRSTITSTFRPVSKSTPIPTTSCACSRT